MIDTYGLWKFSLKVKSLLALHSIKGNSKYTGFRHQEILSEQSCIGLVQFCSIGLKIKLTAKLMFDFVQLLNLIELKSFD